MALKQKPVYVCDHCGKEIGKSAVHTESVPHEGCSIIRLGRKEYEVGDEDFCGLECLWNHIKSALKVD